MTPSPFFTPCPDCGGPTPYNICLSSECWPGISVTTDARGVAVVTQLGFAEPSKESGAR